MTFADPCEWPHPPSVCIAMIRVAGPAWRRFMDHCIFCGTCRDNWRGEPVADTCCFLGAPLLRDYLDATAPVTPETPF